MALDQASFIGLISLRAQNLSPSVNVAPAFRRTCDNPATDARLKAAAKKTNFPGHPAVQMITLNDECSGKNEDERSTKVSARKNQCLRLARNVDLRSAAHSDGGWHARNGWKLLEI